uniref:T-box domain-containing protein n=1 Tax=Macrostomum lignano TaxID=282301 RepID=A0A1I8IZ35_9PLAT
MFPVVRVSFSGLDPEERYHVVMDIVSVDKNRYRYAYHRSAWMVAGKGDPELPQRLYIHPDSPFTGDQLMKQTVSFEKLKLTNNVLDKHYIVLNSMHKYQPRVHLLRVGQATGAGLNPGSGHVSNFAALQSLDQKKFQFPETVFIAVTAYQNQLKKRSAPTLSEKRGNLLQKLEKGLRGWAGAGRAAPNWANQLAIAAPPPPLRVPRIFISTACTACRESMEQLLAHSTVSAVFHQHQLQHQHQHQLQHQHQHQHLAYQPASPSSDEKPPGKAGDRLHAQPRLWAAAAAAAAAAAVSKPHQHQPPSQSPSHQQQQPPPPPPPLGGLPALPPPGGWGKLPPLLPLCRNLRAKPQRPLQKTRRAQLHAMNFIIAWVLSSSSAAPSMAWSANSGTSEPRPESRRNSDTSDTDHSDMSEEGADPTTPHSPPGSLSLANFGAVAPPLSSRVEADAAEHATADTAAAAAGVDVTTAAVAAVEDLGTAEQLSRLPRPGRGRASDNCKLVELVADVGLAVGRSPSVAWLTVLPRSPPPAWLCQ